jgi:lipopolysaccharide transport system ATP-binding protein
MSEIAIEFDGVWKKFKKGEIHNSLRDLIPALTRVAFSRNGHGELHEREFWALRDISFHIRRGEAWGIVGANGAGKSTILKLLSKILRANKGAVNIHGKVSGLIEVGAGFHPDLTGRENVYLNGCILGMKRQEVARKFDQIVEFAGVGDFIDTPVKRYSSGMYARLGFAVAAHVNPDILLVDEVLSVGDFPFQTKCIKKMEEIASNGTTVIFISHNIPAVIQLCPQTILLSKGQIQKSGPSAEVCRVCSRGWSEANPAEARLQLRAVELTAKDGTPENAFDATEWATVRFLVSSQDSLSGMVMGLLIKRSDGLIMFDGNSDKIAHKFVSISAGETKPLVVQFRANLPQGTYFVGLHLFTADKGFHLYEDEGAEFHVTAPKTKGDAFIDTRWDLEGHRAEPVGLDFPSRFVRI